MAATQTGTNAFALLAATLASCMAIAAEPESANTMKIERGELAVVFRDNGQSPGLLSGIDTLLNLRHAPEYDAFDPEHPGASAGLNFEHIISGHRSEHNKFTPRQGRYRLERLPGGDSVALVRDAQDSPWRVASRLQYTVRAPHYVDFQFRCTPQDASLFGRRGFAIFFFANYMNDVAEVPLHFRGIRGEGRPEEWIAAGAPQTHRDWNRGGNYRPLPAEDLPYDEDVQFRLNTWSYDWPRFTKPFYYGRAAHGMTLILMFDRMYSERDQIRFSLYKFKLPGHRRPAWDFQYVVPRVASGEQYGFRGRLVWKPFVSPEDCLAEYERWSTDVRAGRE